MTRLLLVCVAAIALGILAGAVLLMLAISAYLALRENLAPAPAMAIAAGVLAIVGIVGAALLRPWLHHSGTAASTGEPAPDAAALVAAQFGRELALQLKVHPYAGSLGSALAGFALGVSPELRSALRRFLAG
jgi:membrane protein implicated in regulation of membrane protease activity